MQGHKYLENNSGYQENLRCSRTKIPGTGAVRREILMISQLGAPELSALRAASSPEIFVRLHLRFSSAPSEGCGTKWVEIPSGKMPTTSPVASLEWVFW